MDLLVLDAVVVLFLTVSLLRSAEFMFIYLIGAPDDVAQ